MKEKLDFRGRNNSAYSIRVISKNDFNIFEPGQVNSRRAILKDKAVRFQKTVLWNNPGSEKST